jgi:hypothetical protein
MNNTYRRLLRRGAVGLGLAAAAAVVVTPGLAQAAGGVNNSTTQLVVWNNNIENMLPTSCGQDFNALFNYIKAQPLSPDFFTVQQISNQTQLNAFTKRMTDELPGTYSGVIAIANPGIINVSYTSDCGRLKRQQTNAVIYRTDRFTLEDRTDWRSDAPDNWDAGTGGCKNLDDPPVGQSQDRVQNVAARFHDRVANQDVTVASVHWPTNNWHGPLCADENMKEANEAVDRLGGTLKIVAGDMNTSKGTQGWWNDAIDFGFRDPIAETCPSSGCPDSTSTNGDRRIDFMLVKSGHGFSGARTVTEAMVGLTGGRKYSDHRALTATVKY